MRKLTHKEALERIADGKLLKDDCNGNCKLKQEYKSMNCWQCIAKVALQELEVEE